VDPELRIVIEYDPRTQRVQMAYPENKMLCDFLLAEARRIMDREDAAAAAQQAAGRSHVIVPPPAAVSRVLKKEA
jgi:hypothetical protein